MEVGKARGWVGDRISRYRTAHNCLGKRVSQSLWPKSPLGFFVVVVGWLVALRCL